MDAFSTPTQHSRTLELVLTGLDITIMTDARSASHVLVDDDSWYTETNRSRQREESLIKLPNRAYRKAAPPRAPRAQAVAIPNMVENCLPHHCPYVLLAIYHQSCQPSSSSRLFRFVQVETLHRSQCYVMSNILEKEPRQFHDMPRAASLATTLIFVS